MATIQWFPGHMSKARRQVQENLKHVDFVTILVDARLPLSSQNPMLTKIVGDKPKLLILNKADLADSNRTKEWRSYFESQGIKTLAINSKEQSTVKLVTDAAKSLVADKIQRLRERGIQKETLRTMIIGIPNAGKSTLMNRLAGKKIAVVGNKPGVTKGQQWLKSNKDLEILDTPGILWPKFEDELVGLKLAPEIIMEMTRKLGFREDYDRFYNLFVKEVRDGKLGRYTLDIVGVDTDGDN